MAKTKEELEELKKEYEDLKTKLNDLSQDELEQISGGKIWDIDVKLKSLNYDDDWDTSDVEAKFVDDSL